MALSWNEVKDRALRFSKEWADETSEDAEAKSFWDGFFDVFGISRKRLAQFEQAVPRTGRSKGFIDLFWKGTLLVEHKSRGRDLDRAYNQALDYFPGIADYDLPRYVLVSDFARFRLHDLEDGSQHEFALEDFHKHVRAFSFMLGYQKQVYKEEDPVNTKAALLMGDLHDRLKADGYDGHPLEVYLVRLLFCLFADDTAIFERGTFQEYIEQRTGVDGSDLASHLANLFQVLNTPPDKRLRSLDESLAQFPYVNGRLFAEPLPIAAFDARMRQTLLNCCALDWGRISPAIFGSLFQSVMNPAERRNLGAHYTSEKNILKVIKPLFLDDLRTEFERVRGDRKRLIDFHRKLANLRFLDPACGCGNFLIITYRELRLLEIEVIKALQKGQQFVSVNDLVLVDVDKFYGIEYEEFPAQIAQVAMWLIDHQMNLRVSEEFGQYYVRLPLTKSATIQHGNSLRIDWQSLIVQPESEEEPRRFYNYVLGNPPFRGSKFLNQEQRDDMENTLRSVDGIGVLDYVSAWYIKAARIIQNSAIRVAFVSTNSITQGEQVPILWNELLRKYGVIIHFAHRTFSWTNDAKGRAAVHVVIIGFANFDIQEKSLFEYASLKGEPQKVKASNINPYLIDASNTLINGRSSPLSNVAKVINGSIPADGGNLILIEHDYKELIKIEPIASKWLKQYIGAEDFIHNCLRYCLWLVDCPPHELRLMPNVLKRVLAVKAMRLASTKEATRKKADIPTLFTENRQPTSGSYLAIPRTSSENRRYIPMGFLSHEMIAANDLQIVPNATLYQFGLLISAMHMTWIKITAGRLKSDFRYSNVLVYNTFPWPQAPTEKQVKTVELTAQKVLDVRASFPGSSLADLYDPLTMPPALVKAHQELDRAVDACYRPKSFDGETRRIEYLFELYEQYTAPLMGAIAPKRKKKA